MGAILDPKLAHGNANLTAWWRGDYAGEGSSNVLSWADISGNARFLLEGASGSAPVAGAEYQNGHGAVSFDDGAALWLNTGAVAASSFITADAFTLFCAVYVVDIVQDSSTIPENEAIICAQNATNGIGLFLRDTATPRLYAYNNDGSQDSCYIEIAKGQWYVVAMRHYAGSLKLALDGWRTNTATVTTGSTASLANAFRVGANGQASPSYSSMHLGELLIYNAGLSEPNCDSVCSYLLSRWKDRGATAGQGRDLGSRHLWETSRSHLRPRVITPRMDLLDLLPGDAIALEHPECPSPDGDGAGADVWNQCEMRIERMTYDSDNKRMIVQGPALRLREVLHYTSFAPREESSQWRQGLDEIVPGNMAHQYACSTKRWVERASDGLVALVYPGIEPYTSKGVLLDFPQTNYLLNSSFALGNTSWTRTAGAGCTVASTATTTPKLFDTSVSANHMRLTHGGGAVENKFSQAYVPGGTLSGSKSIRVDHEDDAGSVTYVRLQRSGDNKYWSVAGAAWGAASVDNPLTESGAGVIRTDIINALGDGVGLDGLTYTLTILQVAGGTAGRVNKIHHVEAGQYIMRYAQSRVVTGAAIYTPTGAALAYCDMDEANVLTGEHTVLVEFEPLWSTTSADTKLEYVYAGPYVGSLTFDPDTGWFGSATLDGTTIPAAPGTSHVIGYRRTLTTQSRDMAASTLEAFIDDHYYTGAVGAADDRYGLGPVSGYLATPNSYIKRVAIFPRALTREEIAAWRSWVS